MANFLSVTQASKLTGKSPSSIRRLFYDIKDDPTHPDRHHVQPSVDDVLRLREKGENFPWRVSEEFLRQKIAIDDPGKKGTDAPDARASSDANAELISLLRKELEIKNQQIETQAELSTKIMQLNESLSERLREGNHLIRLLQQQLALPEATQRSSVVEAQPTNNEQGKPDGKKTNKPTSKPAKPKRGFFSRLFR